MSVFSSVPKLYDEESTDVTTEDEELEEPPKKRGKNKTWKREKEFNSFKEAHELIQQEKCWRKTWSHLTTDGRKIVYFCNKSLSKKLTCPVALYLLLHCDSQKVSLFRSEDDHANHVSGHGIADSVKEKIMELYEDGVKRPKAIIEALKSRELQEPTVQQITNFLAFKKKQKYGSATINVSQLLTWCKARSKIPDEIDKPYVVHSMISVSDADCSEDLQIFVSTRRLLGLARNSRVFQADATYKLNWQGYPVLIVGTSDLDRRFHPFGLAVCYGESEKDFQFIFKAVKDGVREAYNTEIDPIALLADASAAITNGFTFVFGEKYTRLMCYFHVLKNLDGRLRTIDIVARSKIKADITLLQLCSSSAEFHAAAELFLSKWKSVKPDTIQDVNQVMDFISYFEKSWIEKQSNWYEGAFPKAPSTNNGLESTNAVIKKEYTFRERLPLAQFLDVIENKLVKQWSEGRNEINVNHVKFSTEPTITLPLWTKAYQWAKTDVEILSENSEENITVYYIPSSAHRCANQDFSKDLVDSTKTANLNWASFDDYRQKRECMWTLRWKSTDWRSGNCNCPSYFKTYICKHLVGLAIRLKLVDAPPEAKLIPLGQKRKRGRPSKAKAALLKD